MLTALPSFQYIPLINENNTQLLTYPEARHWYNQHWLAEYVGMKFNEVHKNIKYSCRTRTTQSSHNFDLWVDIFVAKIHELIKRLRFWAFFDVPWLLF